MELKEMNLKDYKGFEILKTWDELDGKKYNIVYMALYNDGFGLFDCTSTLNELKRKIDDFKKIHK